MKQRIKLTESDLHRVIKESVRKVLNENECDEGMWDFMKGVSKKVGTDIADKVEAKKEQAKTYWNSVKAAGRLESNKAYAKKIIPTIKYLAQNKMVNQDTAQAVISQLEAYGKLTSLPQ